MSNKSFEINFHGEGPYHIETSPLICSAKFIDSAKFNDLFIDSEIAKIYSFKPISNKARIPGKFDSRKHS